MAKKEGRSEIMNWLVIGVIVLILAATMAGAKRGFVKTIFSFTSVFVSMLIVLFIRQPVSDLVREQTGIYASIENGISTFVGEKTQSVQGNSAGVTDNVINSLNLPQVLKSALAESNSKAIYGQNGIRSITGYITEWLTELAFQAVCYVISFMLVWVCLRLVTGVLSGVVKLPIIHQIDCIAGAVCGLCTALIIIWIGGIAVTACATSQWGQEALVLIKKSSLLTLLYDNNYLLNTLLTR